MDCPQAKKARDKGRGKSSGGIGGGLERGGQAFEIKVVGIDLFVLERGRNCASTKKPHGRLDA